VSIIIDASSFVLHVSSFQNKIEQRPVAFSLSKEKPVLDSYNPAVAITDTNGSFERNRSESSASKTSFYTRYSVSAIVREIRVDT